MAWSHCQLHTCVMQEVEKVKNLLGLDDIRPVFQRRPLLLDSGVVEATLEQLRGLIEPGEDATSMLLHMPALIYSPKRELIPAVRSPLQASSKAAVGAISGQAPALVV